MSDTTKKKIKNILIRAARTFVQTFLALLATNPSDYPSNLLVSLITFILSLVMSGLKEVPENVQMEALKQMDKMLKEMKTEDVGMDSD